MRWLGCLFVLTSALSFPQVTHAASYFVSQGGNDSASGAQTTPFRSFSKALSVMRAGDVLNIAGGTYNERLNVTVSGSSGAPIVIQSVPGQAVTLDAQGNADTPILIPAGTSHVAIKNLAVRRSSFECVLVRGSNITLTNLDVSECVKFGYRLTGSSITVEGSTCRDSVTENSGGRNTSGGWGSCMRTAPGSRDITIRNNEIYRNWGEGLIIGQAAGAKIYGNTIHDNFSVNIYIGNAYDIDVYGNMTYSTDSRYFRSGRPANCISASEELISPEWGARLGTVRVFNNVAYSCKTGIGYTYKEVSGNGCNNCIFAFNTLVNTDGIKIIDGPKNHIVIANNIMKGGAIVQPGGDIRVSNNFLGDPQFTGIPGAVGAFRLSANSPARSGGMPIAGITTDFDGRGRDSTPDIGAFEGGSGGPAASSPTPSPTAAGSASADLNRNGSVDIFDYNILIGDFGKTGSAGWVPADIIRDGRVDIFDFNSLIEQFGR